MRRRPRILLETTLAPTLAAGLAAGGAQPASAQDPPPPAQDLQAQVNRLAAQVNALQAQVNTLQTSNAALQQKLAGQTASSDGTEVYFTGCNVNIRSGSGITDGTVNGLGILIIGYDESSGETRTGSHNLVVGPYHTYTSYGWLVAGYQNSVSGAWASVSGGITRPAGGQYNWAAGSLFEAQ